MVSDGLGRTRLFSELTIEAQEEVFCLLHYYRRWVPTPLLVYSTINNKFPFPLRVL